MAEKEIGARHKIKLSGIGNQDHRADVGLSMMCSEDLFGLPVYEFGLVMTVLAAVLTRGPWRPI